MANGRGGRGSKSGRRLFGLAGLTLTVSPLFALLAVVMIILGSGYLFLCYCIALILHEMGHAAAAERYGYTLDRISLMPYGAQISGEIGGMTSAEEIKVAAAGPLVSAALAVLFTALWWIVPASYFITQPFVTANVSIVLLNLLPVYPLDGGRIFSALVKNKFPPQKAVKVLRVSGLVIVCAFAAIGAVGVFFGLSPTYFVLLIFVLSGALIGRNSDKYLRIIDRSYLNAHLKKGMDVKTIAVKAETRVLDVIKMLGSSHFYNIVVIGEDMKEQFTFNELELEELMLESPDYTASVEMLLKKRKKPKPEQ